MTSGALRAPLNSRDHGYLVYKDSHGHKLMAGYTTLWTYGANKAGDWRLITLASYDTIMKPATETFNRMLGVLFATLAGAAGFGLWLARRLAKPLLTLTEGAKTIAAGHFDARVVVTSRDEIGALADAFNQMADALEENLGALQREVAERTQAQESLARANNELEQRVEGTHRGAGGGNRRTQTGRGSHARERGTVKRILRRLPNGHGNGGPATAVFKSQPATGGHYRAAD